MKSRIKRRKDKYRVIRKRKSLINSLSNIFGINLKSDDYQDGKFANNNIMNKLVRAGRTIKTNSRKAQQTYRHRGIYGTAVNYSPHDQRQMDNMDFQEKEYFSE